MTISILIGGSVRGCPLDARDRIAAAAAQTLLERGVSGFTVGVVARQAAVSSALVHYHFATKHKLLCAGGGIVARDREDLRSASFEGVGMQALDAVWSALRTDVASGRAGAWLDLARMAAADPDLRESITRQRDRGIRMLAEQLPRLLQSLTAAVRGPDEELAIVVHAELDGLATALLAGGQADAVRTAFDGFWLVLIAGSPTAPL